MRIQHNIMSMNAYRNYNTNTSALSKNLEKLSSGYKINRAGDDAAGLAISEKMRAQITGLDVAQSNAQDGISLIQTAEGALTEVHDMLNRMYELAEKSANGIYEASDRNEMQKEVDELKSEIDRISETANFNGIKLLDGTMGDRSNSITAVANGIQSVVFNGGGIGTTIGAIQLTASASGKITAAFSGSAPTGVTISAAFEGSDQLSEKNGGTVTFKFTVNKSTAGVLSSTVDLYDGMTFTATYDKAGTTGYSTAAAGLNTTIGQASGLKLQIGENGDESNRLTLNVSKTDSKSLGISGNDVNVGTQDSALESLDKIKDAVAKVSGIRGTLGANQNRLEHTINNLSVNEENIQNAESSIRDTDVADEMMAYTKNNILIQSAQAMLAQANQVPQGVLQLLQ